jgi:Glyoxalase/Bleomycin resistance protein/Dioxygenase superfamily
MVTIPAEQHLDHRVQVAQGGGGRQQHPPPDQRPGALQRDLELGHLVDAARRAGRGEGGHWLFAPGAARPADNRTVIIEFLVGDVDAVRQNLAGYVGDEAFVQEPTTMPGGNRSLLFRDPDGNLVR